MKKTTILIIIVLFMVIGYAAYNTTINIYGNGKLAENLSDFKVYLSNLKVNGKEISGINNTKDEFTINDINGDISVDVINDSTEYDTEASLECETNNTWDFDYTGSEQTLTIPITGTYKLETWGAQGGSANETYVGGYGGYSNGQIALDINQKIYVNVGGTGITDDDFDASTYVNGGYNGGGTACGYKDKLASSGGGATHIATSAGLLSSLSNKKANILIVAGGGGGGGYQQEGYSGAGGSGGGYNGVTGKYVINYQNLYIPNGATQTSGGSFIHYGAYTYYASSFGSGGGAEKSNGNASGGGGGYYGGGLGNLFMGAGGGSGYIGNSLLTNKSMYCYNCTASSEPSTKTISTTCVNSTPTANCAKQGNGYARITLMSSPETITTDKVTITAQENASQSLKNITGKSIFCKLKVKKISRTKKAYNGPTEWLFNYTGGEQTFTAPVNGIYKLEVWGAQGGTDSNNYHGGYGGYSSGSMNLSTSDKIYIYVGEKGKTLNSSGHSGVLYAYPNSGNVRVNSSDANNINFSTGGGSTHILHSSGNLSQFSSTLNKVLIVAGGGGGVCTWWGYNDHGGAGGGFQGATTTYNFPNGTTSNNNPTGGTQISGGFGGGNLDGNSKYSWLNGIFGIGGGSRAAGQSASGSGGGGFYGGGASWGGSGAGGSGYIGNSLLTEKSMYCYNCQESSEDSTKTISTTCTSLTPTENCSKQGNGYARITLISTY